MNWEDQTVQKHDNEIQKAAKPMRENFGYEFTPKVFLKKLIQKGWEMSW